MSNSQEQTRAAKVTMRGWPIVALGFLAILFTVALTFATIELPRLLAEALRGFIPDFNPAIEPQAIEEFMQTYHIRLIGYTCLGATLVLIGVGLLSKKRFLASFGAILMFLPTFGYFASSMFFLTGIGVLRLLWLPIWDRSFDLLKLGDFAYLPYMTIVYPLTFLFETPTPKADFREAVAIAIVGIGLLIFLLGTITWFYGKYRKKEVVDFWIYRYSRHPQYLGFIIWSYGVMLLAALSPVVRGGINPGASLPWLLASLLIVGIALSEEIGMAKRYGENYLEYQRRTPFLLPLPRFVSSVIAAPIRLMFMRDSPENGRQVMATIAVYGCLLVLLSLPFVLLDWPPGLGWTTWPY